MRKTLLLLAVFTISYSYGQAPLWNKISEANTSALAKTERASVPVKSELFSLDLTALKLLLQQAPLDSRNIPSNLIISFPNPDGVLEEYRIYEAPIMEKGLSDKFPDLKSYSGRSLKNPAESIRFSVTLFGLHVMSLGGENGTFYIDTYTKDLKNYIVYRKQDISPGKPFQCNVTDNSPEIMESIEESIQHRASDGFFRTYRLAMACTIEYAAFHVNAAGLSGGTLPQKKAAVLSAMTVTMTRVNGVFEKDMSLRMNLITNNDLLIFIDSDSFDNMNANTLINQSQTVIDATVTAGAYDIGHTVSTGGGGLAQLFSPCTASKARGITGSGAPVGDPYDIDYVAHEMGHQWGANHTQNNSCNRNNATAVEPGSASTIMGYAGICPPDVQSNSDAYFHTVSISEMIAFINGTGGTCAVAVPNGNIAPTANAGPDRTIPKGTAFILKGSGSDTNGDALTYCWEQTNNQASTQPPVQTATTGPNFRSLSPSTSPNRYMPPLPNVVAGNLAPTWEVVPTVARTMNFALTVRDNRINGGQTQRDDMVLTVANVGPFLVTSPNTAVSYQGNTAQTITWDVAGTTANGINCSHVDIYMSTNGGLTFPILLQLGTPNDGMHAVNIPNLPGNANRIMIIGTNHIFYDVSNTNFTIIAGTPETSPPVAAVLSASGTTATSTVLSWSGAYDNVAVVSYNIYQNGSLIGSAADSPYTVTGLSGGTTYGFTVRAADADGNLSPHSNQVNVTTSAVDLIPPSAPTLSASGTTSNSTQLSWTGATDNSGVIAYYNVYQSGTLIYNSTASPFTVPGLSGGTTYSFTVRAVDGAGNISPDSNVVTITTTIAYCSSQGNSVADELIGNVQLGSINNASTGGTGYTNFTHISTNLTLGSTNTISITPFWTGTIYNEVYAVFIDYNRNGSFNDPGERVFTQTHTNSPLISGSFTVPDNPAFVGATRMRVSMKYSENAATAVPTPCEVFAYGQVEDYTVNIVSGSNTVVNAKLFIEGYYDTANHRMYPVMANQGIGVSTTDVDMVTFELRHPTTFALVGSTTAMLQTNGLATATFNTVISGSYYLTIKHRCGVQTWSALPLTISSSIPLYDFTNLASKAFDSNMIQVEAGVWAFFTGDLNQDGLVDGTDYSMWETDANNFEFGYFATDLNGDGNVDGSDYSIWEGNSNNFVFSAYP